LAITWKLNIGDNTYNDTRNGITIRAMLDAGDISVSGSQIRINLWRHPSATYAIGWMYIAERDSDERNIIDGTKTTITFGGSGSVSVVSGAGFQKSDWITFSLDSSKNYSITYYLSPSVYADVYKTGSSGRYYFNEQEKLDNDWSALGPGGDSTISHIAFVGVSSDGWTGKICGVTNPSKICGVAVANISKVSGV